MIKWTGLAPWEFEFPFPGSLTSTFLVTGANGNGNGLSGLLAQKIRSLSMHEKGLQLPRHGW